jgi:hypothetical protein
MRTLISIFTAMLATAGLGSTAPVCARDASAVISPLEDKERAEFAKEEVKRRREVRNYEKEGEDASGYSSGQDSANCGTVNIGNTDPNSQTGAGRVVQHDTTVIVTGNVYNTANCGH